MGETERPLTELARRDLLKGLGATVAMLSLAGCGREVPPEQLVPAVVAPPGLVPGETRRFSAVLGARGYGEGVIVTHQTGRPMKVDGNPLHPASLGGSDPRMQASILDLYDPTRARTVIGEGVVRNWLALQAVLATRATQLDARHGAGLRILTGPSTSPSLARRMGDLAKRFPAMRWHASDALSRENARDGLRRAFGAELEAVPNLARVEVVLGIDGDLVDGAPGHLAHARALFSVRPSRHGMSRLYAIEATPTLFGVAADHRFVAAPYQASRALRAVAAALGVGPNEWLWPEGPGWITALAADLASHRGRAFVHLGPWRDSDDHLVAAVVNHRLDAPITYIPPVLVGPEPGIGSLAALVEDMRAGDVDTLVILGANPVYDAPPDLGFADALARVALSVAWATHGDETATACTWSVPALHPFETWGDLRAFDGTAAISQPHVRPLYGGVSAEAVLAALDRQVTVDPQAYLRETWDAEATASGDAHKFWFESLRAGVVDGTAAKPVTVTARADALAGLHAPTPPPPLALLIRPDPTLGAGEAATNSWLQETPAPLTKITWGNAAILAPEDMAERGLRAGDIVEIARADRAIWIPVYALPGQALGCVTLQLGHGRRAGGGAGEGIGTDVSALRLASAPWQGEGTLVGKVGRTQLAITQTEGHAGDRDIFHLRTLDEFGSGVLDLPENPERSLYPERPYPDVAWGMAIDTTKCIGCNACVVACIAENNIPVVGREQVILRREMHWLRVDRWFGAGAHDPRVAARISFQPIPCMHCEHAPCEVVCPVEATAHDDEGLNMMVYNRCIGTRFCANNCPYNVRRFNYLAYAREETQRIPEARNADVSVRGRGVMEKCTYCIQRIAAARAQADIENRRVREHEVKTACQEACPTTAIVFGDINNPDSAVAKRKSSPLDYPMHADLNTRPRTTYAARVVNPNPRIEEDEA